MYGISLAETTSITITNICLLFPQSVTVSHKVCCYLPISANNFLMHLYRLFFVVLFTSGCNSYKTLYFISSDCVPRSKTKRQRRLANASAPWIINSWWVIINIISLLKASFFFISIKVFPAINNGILLVWKKKLFTWAVSVNLKRCV